VDDDDHPMHRVQQMVTKIGKKGKDRLRPFDYWAPGRRVPVIHFIIFVEESQPQQAS
jgi:hypothetical protein